MKHAGRFSRRKMPKLGLAGGAALLLPARGAASRPDGSPPPWVEPFRGRLAVPEVLEPRHRGPAADFYEVRIRGGRARILRGRRTPVWGYEGRFPGPTIRVRKGRPAVVRYANELPEGMTIHAHGAYVDGDSDGHPNGLSPPGGSREHYLGNDQNACALWYHDYAVDLTTPHVYRGPAGLDIIEDDFENGLPLPQDRYDVPLIVQDRSFKDDGSLEEYSRGVPGNTILVSGRPQPHSKVGARKYRFRILNTSNARPFELALNSGRPFTLVATEGGLLERPIEIGSLPITQAERYEVVIDFSEYPRGSRVVLKSLLGRGATADVMCLDVTHGERADSHIPPVLRPAEDQLGPTTHLPADPDSASVTRKFVLGFSDGRWTINGKTWDENRIDAAPREGDTEIWELSSPGYGLHPAHIHLTNFMVLDCNSRAPYAHETGWKDTVSVGNGETVRVLLRWPRVPLGPDAGGFARRYPLHCHSLEHEDHAMMLQFKVLPR